MDKLLQYNAKSDLLRIYFNHLCCRWRISKLDLIFMIGTVLFILNLPLLVDYVQIGTITSIPSLMFYSCIYLLIPSFILFFISNIHNKNMINDIKHEVHYSLSMYRFIYSIYNSIIRRYTSLRSNYSFILYPLADDIRKKDDIVVNIVLIKLFTLYFHNVDNNADYGKVKTETLRLLFQDMRFEEFYNSIMFDIKDGNNSNMVKIILIDAVIQELLTKKWFEEYYESKNIERLVDFILKQWYTTFLKYYYEHKK